MQHSSDLVACGGWHLGGNLSQRLPRDVFIASAHGCMQQQERSQVRRWNRHAAVTEP